MFLHSCYISEGTKAKPFLLRIDNEQLQGPVSNALDQNVRRNEIASYPIAV